MVPRLVFAALVLVSLGSRPPASARRAAAAEARPAVTGAVMTAAPPRK